MPFRTARLICSFTSRYAAYLMLVVRLGILHLSRSVLTSLLRSPDLLNTPAGSHLLGAPMLGIFGRLFLLFRIPLLHCRRLMSQL